MNLAIPELSLVVLIGPSVAGNSTFVREQFRPMRVISSDFCRARLRFHCMREDADTDIGVGSFGKDAGDA